MLFIGASNELGEFESGPHRRLVRRRPAVILAASHLGRVAIWMKRFPPLRTVDSPRDAEAISRSNKRRPS